MSTRLWIAAAAIALFAPVRSSLAAAPVFDGGIAGLELAPQSVAGAAIFIFEYRGLVNGRTRSGWGWIAVNHGELPADLEDDPAPIFGGIGEIYIGLQRFKVDINGGFLTLIDVNDPDVFDDDFGVMLSVDIANLLKQSREHEFGGVLSHEPLIPTIIGELAPAP
jgi:hypothetical protein